MVAGSVKQNCCKKTCENLNTDNLNCGSKSVSISASPGSSVAKGIVLTSKRINPIAGCVGTSA